MILNTVVKCNVEGVEGIVAAYVQFGQLMRAFLKAHETELRLDSEDMRIAEALVYLKDTQKERRAKSIIDLWDVVMDDITQLSVAELTDLTRFFEREEKDLWDVCNQCQEARPISSMVYSSSTGYICKECGA